MVLARPGAGQQRVAAPHGPGDDLGAAVAQLAGDFREEPIVADHQAHGAEAGGEDGVVRARRHAAVDLAARQTDLAILADHLAVGADQHRDVIDQVAVAFQQAGHQVEVVLPRQPAEIRGGRAGDRFSHVRVGLVQTDEGERLAEHDQVSLAPGGLGDQRLVHAAVVRRGPAAAGPEVDGGQAHGPWRRRPGLGHRHAGPAHGAAGGPAQVQLDDRLPRPRGGLIGVRDLGPARSVDPSRGGELGLGHRGRAAQIAPRGRLVEGDRPAARVGPVDLGHEAPPRHGDPIGLITRLEAIGLTPDDGEDLLPETIEALAVVRRDDEALPAIRRPVGLVRELGADLVAGGAGHPAIGGRCRRSLRIRGRAGPAPADQGRPGQNPSPGKHRESVLSAPLHRHPPDRSTGFVDHDSVPPGYPGRGGRIQTPGRFEGPGRRPEWLSSIELGG